MKGIDECSKVILVHDIDNPKQDEEWTVGEICYKELEDFMVRGWDENIDQESVMTVEYVEIATIAKELFTYCFTHGEIGSTEDNEVFTREGWKPLSSLDIGDEIRSSKGWTQLEDIVLSEDLYSFGFMASENPIIINNLFIRSN